MDLRWPRDGSEKAAIQLKTARSGVRFHEKGNGLDGRKEKENCSGRSLEKREKRAVMRKVIENELRTEKRSSGELQRTRVAASRKKVDGCGCPAEV
jgi:hypothetical protein